MILKNTLTIFLQLILSVFFTYELLYPNLYAKWGYIDDHDIIVNLGADDAMSLSEFPSKLLRTEVGFAHGSPPRYRPAYFSAYLLETVAWGGQPHKWYMFRLFLTAGTVFIALYLLSKFFGFIFSTLSCFFLFTEPYWADIWTKLGPAEHYAAFGVALYSLAFYKIWQNKSGLWWLLLSLGAFISFGSKENFLFLLPATGFLFYKKRDRRAITLLSGAIVFLTGIFIIFAVLYLVSRAGSDVYGNSINPKDRILFKLLAHQNLKAFIPVLVTAILFAMTRKLPALSSRVFVSGVASKLKNILLVQTLLFGLWLSQFFFYSGNLPLKMRYDFPGIFFYSLSCLLLFYTPFLMFNLKKTIRLTALICLGVLVVFYSWSNFIHIQTAAVRNTVATNEFTYKMVRMIKTLQANPNMPIVFYTDSAWHYEPILAVLKYFYVYGVTNPAALFYEDKHLSEYKTPIEGMIVKYQQQWSEQGARANPLLPLAPFKPPTGNCFEIDFSGTSGLNCTNLGTI